MIEVTKIRNVVEFAFFYNSIVVLTNKGIEHIGNGNKLEGRFYCIRNFENILLTQNNDENNIIVLDNYLNIVKEITGANYYSLWLLNKNNQIPIDEDTYILNKSLELIKTNRTEFPGICNSRYSISRFKNTIKCTDVFTGEFFWEYDFSKKEMVIEDFILVKNILIVSTSSETLIAINLETGKELWRLDSCGYYFQKHPTKNYLISFVSDTFGDNKYLVIDPFKGAKIIEKEFDVSFETSPLFACITDTHYYFISNLISNSPGNVERITHLGAINFKTHNIEWFEKISKTKGRNYEYQKPEYYNNRFYLLDGEKTLHIYERNEIF